MVAERKISPPLSELNSLRQPLTEGEQLLLDKFNSVLPIVWEIYVQPHLNGLCPDFVLLNPFVGVIVIEVKDWDFRAMDYRWEATSNMSTKTLFGSKDGKSFRLENPLDKAKLYSSEILNLYCPSVGLAPGATPVVSSCVFFSKLSTAQAKAFTRKGFQDSISDEVVDRYYPSIGYDAVGGNLAELIPFLQMRKSKFMKEEYASDLRFWLDEPRSKKEQRIPITLSPDQKKLTSRERTKNGFRRIRGSAGSGKSVVLASKATQIASEGKRVLVVAFNITLGNYLGDLVSRASLPYGNLRKKIDFVNYHMWARRVCTATGNSDRYNALKWKANLDLVLNHSLPSLVNTILEEDCPESLKYDAVLVDEGQDFKLEWWQTLTKVVRDTGEAILVTDKTQDLYESASAWTDEAMKSAGFRGPWNELKISYRLPSDYLPYVRDFLDRYMDDDLKITPEPHQKDLKGVIKTQMRWIQVRNQEDSNTACVNAVLQFPLRKIRSDDNVTYPDIVLLAETIDCGKKIVDQLGAQGIKVSHTFGLGSTDNEIIRRQKVAFFLGAEQVKATTIHSYKGWESTCLIVQILDNATANNVAAAYTALTRLKASERGEDPYITVVCSDPQFEDYGRTWPNFERC